MQSICSIFENIIILCPLFYIHFYFFLGKQNWILFEVNELNKKIDSSARGGESFHQTISSVTYNELKCELQN